MHVAHCRPLIHQAVIAHALAANLCMASPQASNALTMSTISDLSKPVSKISNLHGVPTLFVDGQPFIVTGAQCDIWRSTKQDKVAEAFFSGYREMNATTVSVGVPWSKVEIEENRYDFKFLDWFVIQARKNGLKLVVNLFNVNVCGKVMEGAGSSVYPGYTPNYIIENPSTYQRMQFPYPYKYVEAGPPMCPNDLKTLEREIAYIRKVAKHLRETDFDRTVIMVQLNNEYYYQQWVESGPSTDEEVKAVRCQCPNCSKKWTSGKYATGQAFMFASFAENVRKLSDAFSKEYRLPLYVNSPWWPPEMVPVFLDRCPRLAFVGIDGILTPREPNWLSNSQLSRNIPFAAENPTENSEVRQNLDVLPYYTLFGRSGIGNLLWECHAPFTVVDDPAAKKRYADALYPIKNALVPIMKARNTSRFLGWYALRDIRSDLTTDIFGNFVPAKDDGKPISKDKWFIREGSNYRIVDQYPFSAEIDGMKVVVEGCPAGIVLKEGKNSLVAAMQSGCLKLFGIDGVKAEVGKYVGKEWVLEAGFEVERITGGVLLNIKKPSVIRLTYRRTK